LIPPLKSRSTVPLRLLRFWNVVFGEGDDERELAEVKDEAVEALEMVVLEGGGGGRSRGR
jgi:hypothetical protein